MSMVADTEPKMVGILRSCMMCLYWLRLTPKVSGAGAPKVWRAPAWSHENAGGMARVGVRLTDQLERTTAALLESLPATAGARRHAPGNRPSGRIIEN